MRTKADFRALRETVGMSQQSLARLTCVTVSTAKRWENPAYFDPPSDAWELLDYYKAAQDEMVAETLSTYSKCDAQAGEIILPYHRMQEQCDEFDRAAGDYGVANACSRAAAAALMRAGHKVRFEYPAAWEEK